MPNFCKNRVSWPSCADRINPCYYGPTANIRTALDIDWKKGMTQTAATVGVGSQVVFEWAKSEFHNVYLLPNKADFDSCNFANAQELATNDQNPFTYTPSSAGTFYFGCQVGNGFHCKAPLKLALTVTGTRSTKSGKPDHIAINSQFHLLELVSLSNQTSQTTLIRQRNRLCWTAILT